MHMRLLINFLGLCLLVGLSGQPAAAQDWFVPDNIERAYEAGTRSRDGRPGPNYWQNEADYQMELAINPATQSIRGEETITYYNNSPDNLTELVLQLLYDVYKKGNPRDETIAPEEITDGVDLRQLVVRGDTLDLDDRSRVNRSGTNLRFRLTEPLAAGDSLQISLRWKQPIPPTVNRVGQYDSTSFFIGYCYPKVAVYDDLDGWDTYNHRGIMEYYSPLADYDVTLIVPDNYLVWGTGTLANASDILPENVYQRYERAHRSDTTVTIIDRQMAENGYQMNGGAWRFRAENVPDVAYFLSDHYIWDGAKLEVAEDRNVFIATLYPPENADRHQGVTQLQRDLMDFFSREIPGIPYPYPAYASINANRGGGMEFPMLANNAAPQSYNSMASLTGHEMHHMYFPFYVRINEKKYAWMDEGWADYITDLALYRGIAEGNYEEQSQRNLSLSLGNFIGSEGNVPLMTLSEYMAPDNYYISVYFYAHYSYQTLHQVLGEATFRECFKAYIERWAHKSPTPYDFMNTFEDVSGRDLDWFWQPWYFQFGDIDYGIESIDKSRITVRKIGRKPHPVALMISYENGESDTLRATAAEWENADQLVLKAPAKNIREVRLNPSSPDDDFSNNFALSEKADTLQSNLDRYTGEYPVNNNITIEMERGERFLEVDLGFRNFRFLLFPSGEADVFSSLDEAIRAQFNTDETGEVQGVMINLFGNQIPARKKQD